MTEMPVKNKQGYTIQRLTRVSIIIFTIIHVTENKKRKIRWKPYKYTAVRGRGAGTSVRFALEQCTDIV